MEPCPEPTLTNPWVLVGLCPFTPHKIHYFHPYHITHYYYYLVLFHFHYSLLLLLLMTCHLSPHQRHSRLYNVTRLLYILGQSLTTFFSIVLTKTFAVETSTFLSVSSLLRDCSKICPVIFVHHVLPEQLLLGNCPQFTSSEFSRFLKEAHIRRILCSHICLYW